MRPANRDRQSADHKPARTDSSLESVKWTEQIKILAEERRMFDRYMWQLPVASLGIVAILLNSLNTLIDQSHGSAVAIVLIQLLCAGVCTYSALMLVRLRVRRKIRETRLRQLELGEPDVSVVVSSDDVRAYTDTSKSKLERWFGNKSATSLGVAVLLLVSLALLVASFVLLID